MEVRTYATATEFLSQAGKCLAKDEARYGLMLGLAKRLVENPHYYGKDDPWFYTVSDKAIFCAAAMRTPPFKVVLAYFSGDVNDIVAAIVDSISGRRAAIPGVMGGIELAGAFKDRWCQKHSVAVQKTMQERIFRLIRVNNVPLSPGRFHTATGEDTNLVRRWTHAFYLDTFGTDRNLPESDLTSNLERGEVFLWEDGGVPVSMSVKNRPTDKGMAVGYVYTPPELRGKGYATSCVAELSRHILQSGKDFCTLYTDLANPTSNSIYKKIGYKPVCDSVDYTFEMPEGKTGR
jgi:uncharacterized protein